MISGLQYKGQMYQSGQGTWFTAGKFQEKHTLFTLKNAKNPGKTRVLRLY